MFPSLPAGDPGADALDRLVEFMHASSAADPNASIPLPPAAVEESDNRGIEAGYTYLGQFIDHDITFDPTSRLDRLNDPYALVNFRTPRLDLDSVYGRGPADQPYMYDWSWEPHPGVKLLLDRRPEEASLAAVDLPRNSEGRALIGDARNDEHLIISQLHGVFIRLHNAIVSHLAKSRPWLGTWELFDEAQRLVRWHYQWVVVHEFLEKVVGAAMACDVLARPAADEPLPASLVRRRFYRWQGVPFIPVEFSGAAFRFGHSMVREEYVLNSGGDSVRILGSSAPAGAADLRGFRRLRSAHEIDDWGRFFGRSAQRSMRINHRLVPPLCTLPPDDRSLPRLNLERGRALGLPSGQDVAHAMGEAPLTPTDLHLDAGAAAWMGDRAREALCRATPLWYYVLCEAETRHLGDGGQHLGPVGGRIVAETLVGLLEADEHGYLCRRPRWVPHELPGIDEHFTMSDLVSFARREQASDA